MSQRGGADDGADTGAVMGAYLILREDRCEESGCQKRGNYDVYNTYNSRQGLFCRIHAERRVRELNSWEPGRSIVIDKPYKGE